MTLERRTLNSSDAGLLDAARGRGHLVLIVHGGCGLDDPTGGDRFNPPGNRTLDRPQTGHPLHEA